MKENQPSSPKCEFYWRPVNALETVFCRMGSLDRLPGKNKLGSKYWKVIGVLSKGVQGWGVEEMIPAIMFIFLLADSSWHYAGLTPSKAGQNASHMCSNIVLPCPDETIRTHVSHTHKFWRPGKSRCLPQTVRMVNNPRAGITHAQVWLGICSYSKYSYDTNWHCLFIYLFISLHWYF